LERESPLDALFSRAGRTLQDLPPGARVATGSLRRAAQVLAMRPDFEIAPLRGNVPTRIEKIRRGEADATLLALAGLRRLGLEEVVTQVLASDQVTPPMGQGILGLEARAGEWDELWAAIEHAPTRRLADAERAWLARVGGGCRTPAGVLAEPRDPDGWSITAVLATPDGKHLLRRRIEVPARSEPSDRADASDRPDKSDESDLPALRTAAVRLAETMLAAADPAILATLRTSG
jgi:hydroxymethylbilane synthase